VIPQLPIYKDEESLRELLQRFVGTYGHKAIYSEIRAMMFDKAFLRVATSCGFRFEPHLNSIVNCSDETAAWKAISESKRRQIKKALKSGVSIEENPTERQVAEFYDILLRLYKSKVNKPLIEKEYFLELMDLQSPPYHVKFLLVMYESSVIGGIVAPISHNRVIHEHYVAGLDAEYKNQYPSIVATWAAIDYASKNGIQCFDFMGAGKPDEEYGVRDFKLKFGGELIEPGRYAFVPSAFWYNVATKGFSLYQRFIGHRV
jgi:lipid II:glycine glycyltransferase (peptidoglycan interpeptide bridge formation enzyme)